MSAITFETQLFTIGDRTILLLPEAASQQLSSRGQVMAKGTINAYAFQTALEPDGRWGHWLDVTTTMQHEAGIAAGDTVQVTLTQTKDWPEPEIPADWQAAIDDPEISALWQRVTPMARWEWLRWINSTNNADTRARRIEVSCSKLRNGLRRPCCFNRNMCCVPDVSKNGVLLEPTTADQPL
jgi:hypothetical protein